jgi:serine/threonine protein kinase
MYEVLTGEHPFSGLTPADQLVKHLTEPLPPLRERRPDLPAALEDVIFQATAKDPAERYADATAFATAFRDAVCGVAAEVVTPPPDWAVLEMEIQPQAPAFLDEAAKAVQGPGAVFVARERELERCWGPHYLMASWPN